MIVTVDENISVRKMILKKMREPSVLTVLIIFLFSILSFKSWVAWDKHPFSNDVDQYYSYLVAQFIHHDLGFHFQHNYWLVETPIHEHVPKVTMGLAYLYLPFFIIADNIAYAFDYDGLGYSAPYAWCIHMGSIIYVIIGLWYQRKILILFFNEWITSLIILLILFGTNLFFYTFKESEMAHGYLFCLFSVFLYHTIKWHSTNNAKYLYYLSFIGGLITLIRPTEGLVLLIPLLYNVTSIKTLKLNITKLLDLRWKWILVILLFILPIIPQLIYWKIYAGQFLFFSYGSSEGFFFADPKFYSVLFGWRKGWFIYTPLMLFAVVGLVMMLRKWKGLFIPLAVYMLINLYLICSWWDWGFGGAFGMRALVQTYAFLTIPLAFFIKSLFNLSKIWLRVVLSALCFSLFGFFITNNIFQTWLLKNSLMHWDSMTKEAYLYTFLRSKYTNEDRVYLETLFKNPDYDQMRKGNRDE